MDSMKTTLGETALSRRLRTMDKRGVKQRGCRKKSLAGPPEDWHLADGRIKGIGQSVDDHTPLQLTTEEKRRTRQQRRRYDAAHAQALDQVRANGEPGRRQILRRPASHTGCFFGSPSATVIMRYPRSARPRPRGTSSRESGSPSSQKNVLFLDLRKRDGCHSSARSDPCRGITEVT